jgi:hypothetical protein
MEDNKTDLQEPHAGRHLPGGPLLRRPRRALHKHARPRHGRLPNACNAKRRTNAEQLNKSCTQRSLGKQHDGANQSKRFRGIEGARSERRGVNRLGTE